MPDLVALIRTAQLRLIEYAGAFAPAFTVWDTTVPDARVRNPKKRGLLRSPWGPASRAFCASCGRSAPFAVSETMLKTFYKCNYCVHATGAPSGAVLVPGTEHT